ncbi:MAG: DUF1186 domain-containing protein [Clostridium sp.]
MNKSIEEIFNSIKHNEGRLPKEELQELINRENESRDFLVQYMEEFTYDNKIALEDMSYFGHIYATYLLAQFKEKDFYNIYLDILESPNSLALLLFDDSIIEHGGRIIASIFNGDDTRLIEIIQSNKVDKEIKYIVKDAFEIIRGSNPKYINNIFEEVSNWECFKEQEEIPPVNPSDVFIDDVVVDNFKNGINDFIMKNSIELKLGRNDICNCGSGKKYKRCCGKK